MFSCLRPRFLLASSLALCGLAGAVQAQPQTPGWRSVVSVSPVFEEADLDAGGNVSVDGVILNVGTSTGFGDGNRAGVALSYSYTDYSFDNPVAFGGVAPWGVIQRYGIAAPLSFALQDGWSLGVTPSMDWFRENGASSSDGLVWGANVAAIKRFEDGNFLGLGVAAYSGIEEDSFFPFPIVNWRFGPRWRLINPLPAGPTGPAGLELDYLTDAGWTVGVGAAYRQSRYRLAKSGPVPDGVGEVSGMPVYLRLSREFAGAHTFNAYLGAVAGGELRVEDSVGNLLRTEDFDLAPIIGFNVTLRF
jgi:hypothetical protein